MFTLPRARAWILSATMCFSLWQKIGPQNTQQFRYSPVIPDIRASFPVQENPCSSNIFPKSYILSPENAVPYFCLPSSAPALLPTNSSNLPTVILEGQPCGFIIRSGFHPASEKGISSSGMINPQTPFWPCLDENLSPSSGLRISRNTVLMTVCFSSLVDSTVLSTQSGLLPLKTDGSSRHSSYLMSISYILPFFMESGGMTGVFLFTQISPLRSGTPTLASPLSSMACSLLLKPVTLLVAWSSTSRLKSISLRPPSCFLRRVSQRRQYMDLPKPRSREALLTMTASSMSQPEQLITATLALCPAGSCSYPVSSMCDVFTSGFCGYTSRQFIVSSRVSSFSEVMPCACFPIEHWQMFRGDWLWCGYGISPATHPIIVIGSIYRCVCAEVILSGVRAIRLLSYSFTSRNSITPRLRSPSKSISPLLTSATMASVRSRLPLSRMSSGLTSLPASMLIIISPYWSLWVFTRATLTYLSMRPLLLMSLILRMMSVVRVQPMMLPLMVTRCPLLPTIPQSCTPRLLIFSAGDDVVTHVVRARFLMRPHPSPSGVSHGQIIPQCDPSRARGPAIFLVFSNWELMRVIIPRAEMKLMRLSSCDTPLRSMLKRLMVQLPLAMAAVSPLVMMSDFFSRKFSRRVFDQRFGRNRDSSFLSSELKTLNLSSNMSSRRLPAHFMRLLPQQSRLSSLEGSLSPSMSLLTMRATKIILGQKSQFLTLMCARKILARISLASSVGFLSLLTSYFLRASFLPRYSSASWGVKTFLAWASSKLRTSSCSISLSVQSISWKTSCSHSMPRALKRTNTGMCSWKLPEFTQILPFLMSSPHTLLVQTVYEVTPAIMVSSFTFFSTWMRFSIICSWIRSTFSVPLTMKQPLGSTGHSLSMASSASFLPSRWQHEDPSMIGIRPIFTLLRRSVSPFRRYLMLTRMSPEQVRSAMRASFGYSLLTLLYSSQLVSWVGLLTLIDSYSRKNSGSASLVTRQFTFEVTIFCSRSFMNSLKLSMCCFEKPFMARRLPISRFLSRGSFSGSWNLLLSNSPCKPSLYKCSVIIYQQAQSISWSQLPPKQSYSFEELLGFPKQKEHV